MDTWYILNAIWFHGAYFMEFFSEMMAKLDKIIVEKF